MKNNTKGILGLLAVAAGALGIYKYNKMTPEEKAALKDKAKKAGETIKETYNEVEDQVSEKLTSLKKALEQETGKAGNAIHLNANNIEDAIEVAAEDVDNAVEKQKTNLA